MKRNKITKLTINEVSGVDKAAQVPAQAVLRKRADDDVEKGHEYARPAMTTEVEGHQHVLDDTGQGGETSWVRGEDEEYGHSHSWVRMLDGTLIIGAADGHSHELIPAETIVVAANKSAGGAGGGQPEGVTPMTKATPETAKDAQIPEAVQKSIADLTSRAERAEAIMKLNSDERAVFDGLDTDGQDDFLTKSDSARAEQVQGALDADKVVYKSANGDVFRASDDERLVKMAKERDAERKATADAIAKAEMVGLEKRADAELAHAPGDLGVRAGILKALEGVEGASEFVKAADAALAKNFTADGTTGAGEGEELTKAEDRLEALAKAHQEANPGTTIEKSRALVLETPEGSKLYAEMSA